MLSFTPVHSSSADGNSFACYDLSSDDELISEVAEIVRDLYVEDAFLGSLLRDAAKNLETVCDDDAIQQVIDNVASAVIPQIDESSKKPLHLQVPRNEVAEVLALYVLEHIHGFSVPSSRVRNKEVSGQPSRGIDVLGLTPGVALAITEVKASSASDSPPSVVHSAPDSMYKETLKRLNDPQSLIAEIHWALKHAKAEAQASVAQALILYARPNAPTPTVAPVLVRAAGTYRVSDYGNFEVSPEVFGESPVHFVIVQLPETLESFAKAVYAKASEKAA